MRGGWRGARGCLTTGCGFWVRGCEVSAFREQEEVMSQVIMNLEQVKSIIFQLPVNEFLESVDDIDERAETLP